MLDFNNNRRRIGIVDQEDRALLRSNPSAWLMPEDGREHMVKYMLLSSCSSFGCKAINLLSWCSAPTKVISSYNTAQVRHMSGYQIRVLAVESLHIGTQERVALIGSSGCGKTTLFKPIRWYARFGEGRD